MFRRRRHMGHWLAAFGAASVLLSAMSVPARAFEMSFKWGPTKKCFDPRSPPIALRDVPEGTARLRFHMTDYNASSFQHGGGTVRYRGENSLPYGAFSYKGPCPPQPHLYIIRVEALDAKGKIVGKAQARRRFP